MKRLLFLAAIVALLGSCSAFGPGLAAPTNLTITVKDHAFDLSWDAVSGADSYRIFYTTDNTDPVTATDTRQVIQDITATSYTFGDANPALDYRFVVAAASGASRGDYSEPSIAYQCDPWLTLDVTFSSYNSQPVVARLYSNEGSLQVLSEVSQSTDASGNVVFNLGFPRGTKIGFTVAEDKDSSGTISVGDEVWTYTIGDNTTYLVRTFTNALSTDVLHTIADWETDATTGQHHTLQ